MPTRVGTVTMRGRSVEGTAVVAGSDSRQAARSTFDGAVAEGAAIVRLASYAQEVAGFLRLRAVVRRRYLPVAVGAWLAHESVRRFSPRRRTPFAP